MVKPYRSALGLTFVLGVARVAAFIGVGALSGLVILALKHQQPFDGLLVALAIVAPLAGILHWLESWLAHNMAYQLLADMRIALFRKLDALAPGYLARRRSGDILGVATHDIELIEYFFGHTITPAFVALLVPAVVLGVLLSYSTLLALALLPFPRLRGPTPAARARANRCAERAVPLCGRANSTPTPSMPCRGLADVIAYRQVERRCAIFLAKTREFIRLRRPLLHDLARQAALQELAAGLGSLAVVLTGAALVGSGGLDVGVLPLLTLLAGAAFFADLRDRPGRTPVRRHAGRDAPRLRRQRRTRRSTRRGRR